MDCTINDKLPVPFIDRMNMGEYLPGPQDSQDSFGRCHSNSVAETTIKLTHSLPTLRRGTITCRDMYFQQQMLRVEGRQRELLGADPDWFRSGKGSPDQLERESNYVIDSTMSN